MIRHFWLHITKFIQRFTVECRRAVVATSRLPRERGLSFMRGSVEIIGGGIGGLFAGYVFAKQGWRVRVNERSPSIREIGAGIFLKNNSVTILEHLGIADC